MGGKPEDYGDFGYDEHNITLVMPAILDWIRQINNYQDNYVYQTMTPKYATTEQAKSVALRFLIHYMGDAH